MFPGITAIDPLAHSIEFSFAELSVLVVINRLAGSFVQVGIVKDVVPGPKRFVCAKTLQKVVACLSHGADIGHSKPDTLKAPG